VEDLLSSINITVPEAGKALVQCSFEDTEIEVVETAHAVPLLDIIGRTKITYPCRSTYCTHINVFDLKIWLTINEKEKKWTCPICNKRIQLQNLYIDGYFKEIFESITQEVIEICVHPNGEWTFPQEKAQKEKIIIDLTQIESDDEVDFTRIYIKQEPNMEDLYFPSL